MAGPPPAEVPGPEGALDERLWRKLGIDPLVPASIYAAARLHLLRPAIGQEVPLARIAAEAGADPSPTRRLLEVLTGEGFLERVGPDRFRATALGERLEDPEVQAELRFWFEVHLPYVLRLEHSIRTGGPSFDAVHGASYYEFLDARPAYSAYARGDLAKGARAAEAVLSGHCDLGPVRRIVDVGGSDGALLAAILARRPALLGALFDAPAAIARAEGVLARAGVRDRCDLASGDFLKDRLPEGDAFLLSWVASEWPDDPLEALLANCRRSMAEGGRLWVLEPLIWEEPPSRRRRELDLLIRATVGGHLRGPGEFAALFARAGLRMIRAKRTGAYMDVVEGVVEDRGPRSTDDGAA